MAIVPLPRFTRLPDAERRRILDVATRFFAEEGVDHASYNQIIAAAGISKTSAYNYFDGREDLLNTVLDDVGSRLGSVLGTWQPVETAAEYWSALAAVGDQLRRHVAENPNDLALINPAFLLREQGAFLVWINDFVDNGVKIGLITVRCDRELLVSATAAVLRAGDARGAAQLRAGVEPDEEQLWVLIRNMWGTPRDQPSR
ncbi:TetR/AcrR family transcriptional regulator [Skermania sp. ID1734]|uniref:TetR/AcrR family transcriptional regulator n=1 Tax=Skermania sp. ID1734 TaxID=2597516 RepID=UPI00118170AC|nr:TetR/AcrR family transcriptional regulator [Skermania sp. ID1734]TSE00247.1 TetR/AcrR family transcriptional regulator [Skermania sp. ID1734]